MCVLVNEFGMSHVNSESLVCEEISSQDWFLNISDDENPWERASKTEVEGEGALSIRADRRVVDSDECAWVEGAGAVRGGRGNDTDFGAGVNEKMCFVVSSLT